MLAALAELDVLGNVFTRGVTVAVADEAHCADLSRYRVVSPAPGGTLADEKDT